MKNKSLLVLLAVSAFFIGLDSLVVSPLIPAILSSVNTPFAKGGLLITAYALFYGLAAPLFGPISDKVGRKRMIVTGMLIFSIGTVLTGTTTNYSMILVFRALTGMAAAIVMPSIFALVGDMFPDKQRGMAMGIVMGAMIGSTVLGVPIGAFISQITNWQWTFYVIGVLAFFIFIINMVMIPKTAPVNQFPVTSMQAYFGQFKQTFTNNSVLFALAATLLWTLGLHGMFSYIGVFYTENFNLNVGNIGIVIFLAGLASVIGNILGGKWSDKVGKKKVIHLAALFAALFVLIFSSLTKLLVLAVLIHVLWSASIGFGQSALTSLVSELSPSVRGTVMSLNGSAMYIGMTIASGASSFILDSYSFLAVGILCALSSVLVVPVVGQILAPKTTTTVLTNQKGSDPL